MQKSNEHIEDFAIRAKKFNDEFIALLGKYKIGIGAQAFLAPDGRIAARSSIFDDTQANQPLSNLESS